MHIYHPLLPRLPSGQYQLPPSKKSDGAPCMHRTAAGTAYSLQAVKSKKNAQSFFRSLGKCFFPWLKSSLAAKAPVASPPALSVQANERWKEMRELPGAGPGVQLLVAIPRKGDERIFAMSGVSEGVVKETERRIFEAYNSAAVEDKGAVLKKTIDVIFKMSGVLLDLNEKNGRPGRENFDAVRGNINHFDHIGYAFRVFPRENSDPK